MVSLSRSSRRSARTTLHVGLPTLVVAFWVVLMTVSVVSFHFGWKKIDTIWQIQRQQHMLVGQQQTSDSVLDCLIVGSGWAGLGAADYLRTQGLKNFEVVDARDYIGGRSRTVYDLVDNVATELGSAFLYTFENSVRALAHAGNVKYATIDYDDKDAYGLYDESGEVVGTLKEELMEKEWNQFADFAEQQANMLEATGMDKPFQATIDLYVRDENVSSRVQKFLNSRIQARVAVEFGARLNDISTVDVGQTIGNDCLFCGGADYYLSVEGGGFDKTLDKVAAPLKSNIHLNTQVTEINYSEQHQPVQVLYVDKNGVPGVKLAKTVIVTASLGVLKANGIQFHPPFPQSKQEAIDFLSFGTLNKCILYWETPQDSWWPKGKTWMTYMGDDENKSAPGTRPWTSFFNDKDLGNGGHYILSSWTGGTIAEAAESDSDEETVAIVLSNLRAMFGPEVPAPSKYIITRWGQDEFTRGSYSFKTAYDVNNEDQTRKARLELAKPIDMKLFFAGEATTRDYGTTYGAFDSGKLAGATVGRLLKGEEQMTA